MVANPKKDKAKTDPKSQKSILEKMLRTKDMMGILPYLNGTNPDVDLGTISITAAPSSHKEEVMV